MQNPDPYNPSVEIVDVGTSFHDSPSLRVKYNPASGGQCLSHFAIETEGFTRTDTYVIHLAIEVEGGQLKEKAIKMTLETNSGTVYTITRRKGGGKYKIHTMLLYRSN